MKYPVKNKKSFGQNIREILPKMFSDFMAHKNFVISNAEGHAALHKMRISGKPLRYLMEIKAKRFGKKYIKCAEEIKKIIELMGEIHDCDVMIPEIIIEIHDIERRNQLLDEQKKISTHILIDLAGELHSVRKKMFSELCGKLEKWDKTDFKSMLK